MNARSGGTGRSAGAIWFRRGAVMDSPRIGGQIVACLWLNPPKFQSCNLWTSLRRRRWGMRYQAGATVRKCREKAGFLPLKSLSRHDCFLSNSRRTIPWATTTKTTWGENHHGRGREISCAGLGRRRIQIRPQLVSGNASHTLDGKHPQGRHFLPLRNSLLRDPKRAGERCQSANCFDRAPKRVLGGAVVHDRE